MQNSGLENNLAIAYYKYERGKHGGEVGDVVVKGHGIPLGSVIVGGMIHVLTGCNSAGTTPATLGVKALTSGDILASTAITGLKKDSLVDIKPDMKAANAILVRDNMNEIVVSIGTAALTSGKFVLALYYIVTD